jgi:hypothetical protein
MKYLQVIGVVMAIAAGVVLVIWWNVFRFDDCRRVGHALLYCILDIGH